MKLLVDNFKIKTYYKDGSFYDKNDKKIDESIIQEIFLNIQEFKEIMQSQLEKKSKKKTKDG